MKDQLDVGSTYDLSKDELLIAWYDSELRKTTGIGYDEAQGFREDFAKAFNEWCTWHSLQGKICNEWNYCQKVKACGTKLDLSLALASFISSIVDVAGAASFSAAVLIVRYGFGVVCECDEMSNP